MNKIVIVVLMLCVCFAATADGICRNRRCEATSGSVACVDKGCRRRVANVHAKIDAVRKYIRKERNADNSPISSYSNIKAPEPASQQAVVPTVVVPTVAANSQTIVAPVPIAESKVVNIYGGSVVIND